MVHLSSVCLVLTLFGCTTFNLVVNIQFQLEMFIMVQFIAVSMKEKTGNEDFKAACRVSQEPGFFGFGFFFILSCEQ